MIITSIASRVNLFIARRKWRKKNSNNFTYMSRLFNPKLVEIGRGSYGSLNIINFSDNYKLKMGSYCSVAENVYFIVCGEHRYDTISSYPFKVRYCAHKFEALSKGDIIIEDDVWFGENVTVLSGVHIGQGALIAAGSIVTKDIPPYAIVAGNPAKVIKNRFSDELIKELMKIDYGKLTPEMIRANESQLYKSLIEKEQLEWMPMKEN